MPYLFLLNSDLVNGDTSLLTYIYNWVELFWSKVIFQTNFASNTMQKVAISFIYTRLNANQNK